MDRLVARNRVCILAGYAAAFGVLIAGFVLISREAVAGIATEQDGFRAAWIGHIDKGTRDVKPVALWGLPEGFFESVKPTPLPGADWPAYLAEVAARNRSP